MATTPDTAVAQPADDADSVRSAFRLGWAIAELRGRYRPDLPQRVPDPGPEILRVDHALPLANERNVGEQRVEVITAVKGLSGALGLDFPQDGQARSEQLDRYLNALNDTPDDATAWNGLTNGLYLWDARMQDALVMRPGQAAGYQLGRGLAETYWALDPAVVEPNDARSWEFLLGARRRATLKRYVARLVNYLDPLVLPAVSTSLDKWGEVAADERWRSQPDAGKRLYAQTLMWRDLIRGERRAQDLDPVPVGHLVQEIQLIPKLWAAFWPQLLLGLLGVAMLVAGVIALVIGSKDSGIGTTLAVLGALGITATSGYARAKANAISVLSTVRDAINSERAGRAASIFPERPIRRRGGRTAT